ALGTLDALEQTAAAALKDMLRVRRDQCIKAFGHDVGLASNLGLELGVLPVVQRCRGRHKRRVETAEGAVVLTWPKLVQIATHRGDRQRQPVTGKRLGQRDDVGLDLGGLEAEERSGASAACLDV